MSFFKSGILHNVILANFKLIYRWFNMIYTGNWDIITPHARGGCRLVDIKNTVISVKTGCCNLELPYTLIYGHHTLQL